jgi:AhpD family alkylhydroperoxidase
MSTAAEFYETWPQRMNAAKAKAPDIGRAFGPFFRDLMKDGALPSKQKELIALGIGIALRCEACIYTHVEKCLKAGASGAEIMEAAGVAVMMGGGPAYTSIAVVAEAVEACEKGAAQVA